MSTRQCPNGHLYDDAKSPSCPYCVGGAGGGDVGMTRPIGFPAGGSPSAPQGAPAGRNCGVTMPIPPKNPPVVKSAPAQNVTKFIDAPAAGSSSLRPVRGWLVVISEDHMGKDFRLHGEKNVIGRSKDYDVNIDFDTAVSSSGDAIISYDDRKGIFFAQSSGSRNNVRVNDNLLLMPVQLKEYDVIEVGRTKLVFRSLCSPNFVYPSEAEE